MDIMDSEIAANQCLKHRIRCQNYCRLLMHCSLVGSRGRFATAMASLATSSLVYNIVFSSVFCADLSSMIGVGAAEVHLLNVCNGSVFSLFGSALAVAVAVASRLAGGAVA